MQWLLFECSSHKYRREFRINSPTHALQKKRKHHITDQPTEIYKTIEKVHHTLIGDPNF